MVTLTRAKCLKFVATSVSQGLAAFILTCVTFAVILIYKSLRFLKWVYIQFSSCYLTSVGLLKFKYKVST